MDGAQAQVLAEAESVSYCVNDTYFWRRSLHLLTLSTHWHPNPQALGVIKSRTLTNCPLKIPAKQKPKSCVAQKKVVFPKLPKSDSELVVTLKVRSQASPRGIKLIFFHPRQMVETMVQPHLCASV